MPTLPAELWMAIAEFIGTVELENLIGVNRIFFEIVMDNRYREMELIDADPISLFRKIDRLQYVFFSGGPKDHRLLMYIKERQLNKSSPNLENMAQRCVECHTRTATATRAAISVNSRTGADQCPQLRASAEECNTYIPVPSIITGGYTKVSGVQVRSRGRNNEAVVQHSTVAPALATALRAN